MRSVVVVVGLVAAVAACGRSSRELDRVTDACVAAHERAARATDPAEQGRELALGCADTYGERACADALRRSFAPGTDPAARPRIVLEACVAAYCPGMLPPKPDLCSRDLSALEPTALAWDGTLRDWQMFNVRVRNVELGPARAARLEEAVKAGRNARESREPDAGPLAAPPRVVVRVGKVFVDDAQVFAFPEPDDGRVTRIDALFDALKAKREAAKAYAARLGRPVRSGLEPPRENEPELEALRDVRVELEPSLSASRGKSVMQTIAFAGYDVPRLVLFAGTPRERLVRFADATSSDAKVHVEVRKGGITVRKKRSGEDLGSLLVPPDVGAATLEAALAKASADVGATSLVVHAECGLPFHAVDAALDACDRLGAPDAGRSHDLALAGGCLAASPER